MVAVAYHAGERCSPLRIIRASLLCHSSFLTPHSSLFTPVFKLDKCLKKCYYTIVIKLICKFSIHIGKMNTMSKIYLRSISGSNQKIHPRRGDLQLRFTRCRRPAIHCRHCRPYRSRCHLLQRLGRCKLRYFRSFSYHTLHNVNPLSRYHQSKSQKVFQNNGSQHHFLPHCFYQALPLRGAFGWVLFGIVISYTALCLYPQALCCAFGWCSSFRNLFVVYSYAELSYFLC